MSPTSPSKSRNFEQRIITISIAGLNRHPPVPHPGPDWRVVGFGVGSLPDEIVASTIYEREVFPPWGGGGRTP